MVCSAHPDASYRLQTLVLELKEDREVYLIAPALWPELATEANIKPKLLATAVNRQNVLFLWELNLPRPDGRTDEWSRMPWSPWYGHQGLGARGREHELWRV